MKLITKQEYDLCLQQELEILFYRLNRAPVGREYYYGILLKIILYFKKTEQIEFKWETTSDQSLILATLFDQVYFDGKLYSTIRQQIRSDNHCGVFQQIRDKLLTNV